MKNAILACAALGLFAADVRAQTMPPPVVLRHGWRLQDAAKAAVDGAAVSAPGYRTTGWYAATVPGTVLTTLVNNGVYPEPLYGLNNQKIPDTLCQASYWYRTEFTAPASYAGRRIWLNFEGINHKADVWVDGHRVGKIEGAFMRGAFDVTPYVAAGRPCAVAVRITPPPHASGGISHPSNPVLQTLANGYGPNGGNLEGDAPTFFCAEGWDWIPTIHDRDIGVWQDVTLSATGPVVLRNPYVTHTAVTARAAAVDLTVRVDLQNVADEKLAGTLGGEVAGRRFSQSVAIDAHSVKTVALSAAMLPALHLTHPKLWWPNGYGAQSLYTIPLTFTVGKAVSDARSVTFGVRTIDYGGVGNGWER